jgi:hypothetical protein
MKFLLEHINIALVFLLHGYARIYCYLKVVCLVVCPVVCSIADEVST